MRFRSLQQIERNVDDHVFLTADHLAATHFGQDRARFDAIVLAGLFGMAQDVHDYHHKLSVAERHVFENVLAYLTTSDILAMRNIGLAVMEKMSAPELQIYQARQVYEEALHTWTYQHCIESLGLDQQEIYNRYRVVPEIHGKIALANRRLEKVLRSDFDLEDRANLHEFALSYFFFAVIFEGCWFYNGFTPVFALRAEAPVVERKIADAVCAEIVRRL